MWESGAQREADGNPKGSTGGEFNKSTIYEGAWGGLGVHRGVEGGGSPDLNVGGRQLGAGRQRVPHGGIHQPATSLPVGAGEVTVPTPLSSSLGPLTGAPMAEPNWKPMDHAGQPRGVQRAP